MFCESSKLEIHASQGQLTVAVSAVGCLVARVDETRCAWVADGWTAKRATSNRHVGLVTNLALADRRVVDALALRAAVMIVVGPVPRLALRSQNWFSKRKQQLESLQTCKWMDGHRKRAPLLTHRNARRALLVDHVWMVTVEAECADRTECESRTVVTRGAVAAWLCAGCAKLTRAVISCLTLAALVARSPIESWPRAIRAQNAAGAIWRVITVRGAAQTQVTVGAVLPCHA